MKSPTENASASAENADPPAEHTEQPAAPEDASSPPPPAPGEPLMEEVQSFLSRRAELARKLAEEIEATEKKLAELKKTAAMLFPESNNAPLKDRKPKKPKAKAPREEKAESAPAEEAPPAHAAE